MPDRDVLRAGNRSGGQSISHRHNTESAINADQPLSEFLPLSDYQPTLLLESPCNEADITHTLPLPSLILVPSPNWVTAFPRFHIEHLPRLNCDHASLRLVFPSQDPPKAGPFKFLRMWTLHDSFSQLNQKAWSGECSPQSMIDIQLKLKKTKQLLKVLNKETFSNFFFLIQKVEEELDRLDCSKQSDPSKDLSHRYIDAKQNLSHLHLMQVFWKQKSRNSWLLEGDRNTKFFHSLANERVRRASITSIKNAAGETVSSSQDIKAEVVRFFEDIFQAESTSFNANFIQAIPRVINHIDNASLLSPPSIEEVKAAALSMPRDGAAGPNGFSAAFYASYWDIVRSDILKAVRALLEGSALPRSFTSNLICLIPKTPSVTSFSNFRPISLCNVIYKKKFAKLLANRLGLLLPKMISQEQGVFIQGRSIVEHIALAHEMIRDINRKVRGGNLILKLNLEKAYNRVNWDYLKQVLLKFSFNQRWVQLMESCWGNNWFSILINGEPAGFFKSNKGLRQGDPLSPALFLIVMESFSANLKLMIASGGFQQFSRHRGCPVSSHLLFVDDILLFTNGRRDSLLHLNNSLALFQIKALAFQFLVDKVDRKTSGWAGRLISQAGRVTLVCHVLSSILIHILSAMHTSHPCFWPLEVTGNFSVQSAKKLLRPPGLPLIWPSWIWLGHLPPKISIFLWRTLQNAILVDSYVQAIGVAIASKCRCYLEDLNPSPQLESISHLFLFSRHAQALLASFNQLCGVPPLLHSSIVAYGVGSNNMAKLRAIHDGMTLCLEKGLDRELIKETVVAATSLKDSSLVKLLKDEVVTAVTVIGFDEKRILSSLLKHPFDTTC
ncbi:uncharacterized protein LOC131244283 [Magnolia sinica]|uniref:uncharacterized protein LOC131244283 n=1 Tax=Magnolia sinica TaxID=86752 RepID=UPI0026587636|nr:uncharacterized protein LOC131244283 [Magnolia sinica]